MRKIHKITNIALIYMLIGVFLYSNTAYATPSSYRTLRLQVGEKDDTYSRLKKSMEELGVKPDHEKSKVEIINAGKTIGGYIVIARVGEGEYEISSTGVKRYKEDLTSEEMHDLQRCREIASMVSKVDEQLLKAAIEEKWEWWPETKPDKTLTSNQRFSIVEVDRRDKALIEKILDLDREYFDSYPVKLIEKGRATLVALTNKETSELIGYALYKPRRGNEAYLVRGFIVDEYRGQGLNDLFIEYLKKHFDYVSLSYSDIDVGERLMLRYGFKPATIPYNLIWEKLKSSRDLQKNL